MDNNVNRSSGAGKSSSMVSLGDFKLTEVLGCGRFSQIILGEKVGGVDHDTLYAIKIQNKEYIKRNQRATYVSSELEILKEMHGCPFILKMHYAFHTSSRLFMVSEFVSGGDFLDLIFEGPFSVEDTRIYTAELVLALEQLHARGIMHRHIKMENVMLDERGHVVLVDFGLSIKQNPFERYRMRAGTSWYMAPEMAAGTYYNQTVDWWSFGTLTFEMVLGWPLFFQEQSNSDIEVFERIMLDEIDLDIVPEEISDFILALLTKDPFTRLGSSGAEEVKRHPFYSGIDWLKLARKEVPVPDNSERILGKDVYGTSFLTESDVMMLKRNPPPPRNTDPLLENYLYVSPSLK